MSQSNQHLRVPPTYAGSLNSDFSTSDVVSSTVPEYSRAASPNERTLAGHPVRTFSALSTQDLPARFEFSTRHATLDLGERNWYCPLPCYGYAGTVEGVVRMQQIETVSKIEVSLVGEVVTTVSEAAIPSQSASKRFFKQKITVWDSAASGNGQPNQSFSLSFPGELGGSTAVLPPSCRIAGNESVARVQYGLQVDLFRKGLRRHKRFEVEVLYLPKSFAPALHNRPIHMDNKSGDSDWARHVLMPVHAGRSNVPNPEVPWEMMVELFLPSQTTFTATSIVPYTMRIHSVSTGTSPTPHNPASLALVEVSVQLIKSTIVMVHGIRKRRDIVLASGITSSDYQGANAGEGDPGSSSSALDGVRIVNGSLEAGVRSGSELSWEFQDFIEVKYCLIVSAKPPANVRALEGAFPTFQVNIDVSMKTHTKQEDIESADYIDSDPSIGLFDVALRQIRSN
ncbi:hypothetical protein BDV93DRAFT_603065 [Ceratobasidium sp. AG-I]|nr:hypothetical protein BDV93DRAFT_603065 [Ceratobasidium sp. AG-I]